MLNRRQVIASIAASALTSGAAAARDGHSRPAALGLTNDGGKLLRNGKPYRGMGCNFYDVLDHREVRARFRTLKNAGVPFIRFDFGTFYPGRSDKEGWRVYLADRAKWHGVRDTLVAEAEECGIGLIPSLFWRLRTIPELMSQVHGLNLDLLDWSVPRGRSRTFAFDVTHETVDRYKASPAIWGWEMGNEYSNLCAAACWATDRDREKGVIDFAGLRTLYRDWSAVVRRADPSGRILSTGEDVPNPGLRFCVTGAPAHLDPLKAWLEIPADGTTVPAPIYTNPPDAFDVVSIHWYQRTRMKSQWFRGGPAPGPAGILRICADAAKAHRRPLFVGEFGSLMGSLGQDGTDGENSPESEKAYYLEMIDALVENEVALSAVWNFGFLQPNHVRPWNIDPGTRRAYMLDAIAEANQRLSAS